MLIGSRRLDAQSWAVFGDILAESILSLAIKRYTSLNAAKNKGKINQYLGQLRKAERGWRDMNAAQAGNMVEDLGE